MSDDVVSEARALVERLYGATGAFERLQVIADTAPQALLLLHPLLALVDEQRTRLDALAPLEQAAARVREASGPKLAAEAAHAAVLAKWEAAGCPIGRDTEFSATFPAASRELDRACETSAAAEAAFLALARGER